MGLEDVATQRLRGIQANLWTETVDSEERAQASGWPCLMSLNHQLTINNNHNPNMNRWIFVNFYGSSFSIWTCIDWLCEEMLFPRLFAVAEVAWTMPERKTWEDFKFKNLGHDFWFNQFDRAWSLKRTCFSVIFCSSMYCIDGYHACLCDFSINQSKYSCKASGFIHKVAICAADLSGWVPNCSGWVVKHPWTVGIGTNLSLRRQILCEWSHEIQAEKRRVRGKRA